MMMILNLFSCLFLSFGFSLASLWTLSEAQASPPLSSQGISVSPPAALKAIDWMKSKSSYSLVSEDMALTSINKTDTGVFICELLENRGKRVASTNSCDGWETPVFLYTHREIEKAEEHLGYVKSLIDNNSKLSAFFKSFESGDTLRRFTMGDLQAIEPMAYYDEFEDASFGWLYDGIDQINSNAKLSTQELAPFISKVVSCASESSRKDLNPLLLDLCQREKEFQNFQSTDQQLVSFINSYGASLTDGENSKVNQWQKLTCEEGVEKCPIIAPGTFDFFQEYTINFKVAGACTLDLYNQELTTLCEVLKVLGFKSVPCENHWESDLIDFGTSCQL